MAEPIDNGPFSMAEETPALDAACATFLRLCRETAEREMAGKPLFPVCDAMPGASVVDRTIFSIALLALCNGRHDVGASNAFNFFDGIAHGLGATLGQQPTPVAEAAMLLLRNNVAGYEARTRASMTGKGPLNG